MNNFGDYNNNNTSHLFDALSPESKKSEMKIKKKWEINYQPPMLNENVNTLGKETFTAFEAHSNQSAQILPSYINLTEYKLRQNHSSFSTTPNIEENESKQTNRDQGILAIFENNVENAYKKRKLNPNNQIPKDTQEEILDLVKQESFLANQLDLMSEANKPHTEWNETHREYLIIVKKRQKLVINLQQDKLDELNFDIDEANINCKKIIEQNNFFSNEMYLANQEIKGLTLGIEELKKANNELISNNKYLELGNSINLNGIETLQKTLLNVKTELDQTKQENSNYASQCIELSKQVENYEHIIEKNSFEYTKSISEISEQYKKEMNQLIKQINEKNRFIIEQKKEFLIEKNKQKILFDKQKNDYFEKLDEKTLSINKIKNLNEILETQSVIDKVNISNLQQLVDNVNIKKQINKEHLSDISKKLDQLINNL